MTAFFSSPQRSAPHRCVSAKQRVEASREPPEGVPPRVVPALDRALQTGAPTAALFLQPIDRRGRSGSRRSPFRVQVAPAARRRQHRQLLQGDTTRNHRDGFVETPAPPTHSTSRYCAIARAPVKQIDGTTARESLPSPAAICLAHSRAERSEHRHALQLEGTPAAHARDGSRSRCAHRRQRTRTPIAFLVRAQCAARWPFGRRPWLPSYGPRRALAVLPAPTSPPFARLRRDAEGPSSARRLRAHGWTAPSPLRRGASLAAHRLRAMPSSSPGPHP